MHTRSILLSALVLFCGCGAAGSAAKTTVNATWSLKKADGTAAACPASYTSVKLTAQAFTRSLDTSTGDPFVAVFPCAAGSGSIALQVSGDEPGVCDSNTGNCTHNPAEDISGKYQITAVITEASGQTDYVLSWTQQVDVTTGTKSLHFDLYPEATYRLLNWGIYAKSTVSAISCAAAAADTVKVYSKRVTLPDGSDDSTSTEHLDTFPCANAPELIDGLNIVGAGISQPLDYGRYTARFELFSGGTKIGTKDADPSSTIELKRDTTKLIGGITEVYFSEKFYIDADNR